MEIHSVKRIISGEWVKLSAQISVRGRRFEPFIKVPKTFASYVVSDTSPFLVAGLLPALSSREPIHIQGSVSPKLLTNIKPAMNLLQSWDIGLTKVPITASSTKRDTVNSKGRGLFFSGGVDSFYTYLKTKSRQNTRVTHFIFVHGFDIGRSDMSLYRRVFSVISSITQKENVTLIPVETNLRDLLDRYVSWDFTHGAALSSIALALRNGLSSVYLSSDLETAKLPPYGLNPRLDPHWGTEGLKIVHYGADMTRFNKIKFIADSKLVGETLRVCWINKRRAYNCSECEKCLRTMVALFALGKLSQIQTFPNSINPERVAHLHLKSNYKCYYEDSLKILQKTQAFSPITVALKKSLTQARHEKGIRSLLAGWRHTLGEWDAKYLHRRAFRMLTRYGVM